MKKSYSLMALSAIAMTTALAPTTASAKWGTPAEPCHIISTENTISSLKTAMTPDGKTWLSWLTYSTVHTRWGFEVRLQLLDQDGNLMFPEEGIRVEDQRNASWTADYSLVSDAEGNAIVSWADARNDDPDDRAQSQDPVLYKISQQGEQLWGEDGVELGKEFQYPPILYMIGNDLYAQMMPGDEAIEDYPTMGRINLADGSFDLGPVGFSGQLIASENGDFISVGLGYGGTEAMRYNRDIQPVWAEPALVSTDIYGGHGRFPYQLVSDGQGGVVISFSRAMGGFQHMPVVQYVSGDGEAVFGAAADVIITDVNDHSYNVIGVNTDEQTILSTWQISSGKTALAGQLMDFFGERLWGDDGLLLADKQSYSGYSYGPIAIYPTEDAKWLVVYADEIGWAQNQLYVGIFDADGNEESLQEVSTPCALDNIKTYLVGSNLHIFFADSFTDDDWNETNYITDIVVTNATSAISDVAAEKQATGMTEYYSVDGLRLNGLQRGINIVRQADGTVQKVLVRE